MSAQNTSTLLTASVRNNVAMMPKILRLYPGKVTHFQEKISTDETVAKPDAAIPRYIDPLNMVPQQNFYNLVTKPFMFADAYGKETLNEVSLKYAMPLYTLAIDIARHRTHKRTYPTTFSRKNIYYPYRNEQPECGKTTKTISTWTTFQKILCNTHNCVNIESASTTSPSRSSTGRSKSHLVVHNHT